MSICDDKNKKNKCQTNEDDSPRDATRELFRNGPR